MAQSKETINQQSANQQIPQVNGSGYQQASQWHPGEEQSPLSK